MASKPSDTRFASLLADPDKLLSNERISELTDIPLGTVRKWPSEGKSPRRFRIGKYVRYRAGDVYDWLIANSVD